MIFVPCNHPKYAAVAQVFREIIDNYDPEFESLGLDEAHLDITDYCEANEISTEEEIKALVQKIRDDIKKATQLTCSAGIGCNKMIAKICTDLKKPDGQTFMPSDLKSIKEFMCSLPIRKVPYIGKMIELTLNNLGIETVKEGLEKAAELKIAYDTKNVQREFLFRSFLGLSKTTHYEESPGANSSMGFTGPGKSVSVSHTFEGATTYEEFKKKLISLSQWLAYDMAKRGNRAGDQIQVIFKTKQFEVINKTVRLNTFIWK